MKKSTENYYLQHEIIQAYVRLVFISLLIVVLIYWAFSTDTVTVAYTNNAYMFAGFFFVVDLLHLYGLKNFSGSNPKIRKYFILHVDIFSTFIGIWVFDHYGVLFSTVFIWIIIGYAMRFGKPFLSVAMLSSLIAILILSLFHPYWNAHPVITLSVALATIVIPVFVTLMTGEIHKKNSELRRLLDESDFIAHHDHLTKLPNRAYFYKELKDRISGDEPFSLLFIDLDGFKAVNDCFGHETGDAVLLLAAQRMLDVLGDEHFVARLGGDEFVVMTSKSGENLERLLHQLVKKIAQSYQTPEHHIDDLSASIGISSFPDDTTESFLIKKYADKAMYAAKNRGKNQFTFYRDLAPSF